MVMLTREEEAGKVRKRAGLGLVTSVTECPHGKWVVLNQLSENCYAQVELNPSQFDTTIVRRFNEGFIRLPSIWPLAIGKL